MISVEAERSRLAARLAHRLESTVLIARELAARSEADRLDEQLQELSRRARGLARCCATGADAATALRDALADWMGADAAWGETADGYEVEAAPGRELPEAAELGEPLARLLAAESGAELVSWTASHAVVRVPAC